MIAGTSFIRIVSVISRINIPQGQRYRKGTEDVFDDPISFELKGRDVDRNSQRMTVVLPGHALAAHVTKHPPTDRNNETIRFKGRK